jgi:DNA-directed RNA polymerase subunit RPC12/RpoP
MKSQKGLLIGSSFAASVFAFGIASGAISLKDASIASLVGIPVALISHTVTDSIAQKIEETTNKAQLAKRSFQAGTAGSGLARNGANSHSVSTDLKMTVPSNPTIGGESQSSQKPHCPHCGSDFLNLLNDGRYRCLDCKKRFVTSKIVWK